MTTMMYLVEVKETETLADEDSTEKEKMKIKDRM